MDLDCDARLNQLEFAEGIRKQYETIYKPNNSQSFANKSLRYKSKSSLA
jgi:hypothetical protein